MKPHNAYCIVPSCPICNKPGHGIWYLPPRDSTATITNKLEFVVHHGINNQAQGLIVKGIERNSFCRTGLLRKAKDGEIVTSRRSSPNTAPDWNIIRRLLEKKKRPKNNK